MKHWWQQKTQRLMIGNVGAGAIHAAVIGALTIVIVILYTLLTADNGGVTELGLTLA